MILWGFFGARLTEMTVSDLIPYTFYKFAVRSNTAQLVSSYSLFISCRTQEGSEYMVSVLRQKSTYTCYLMSVF